MESRVHFSSDCSLNIISLVNSEHSVNHDYWAANQQVIKPLVLKSSRKSSYLGHWVAAGNLDFWSGNQSSSAKTFFGSRLWFFPVLLELLSSTTQNLEIVKKWKIKIKNTLKESQKASLLIWLQSALSYRVTGWKRLMDGLTLFDYACAKVRKTNNHYDRLLPGNGQFWNSDLLVNKMTAHPKTNKLYCY